MCERRRPKREGRIVRQKPCNSTKSIFKCLPSSKKGPRRLFIPHESSIDLSTDLSSAFSSYCGPHRTQNSCFVMSLELICLVKPPQSAWVMSMGTVGRAALQKPSGSDVVTPPWTYLTTDNRSRGPVPSSEGLYLRRNGGLVSDFAHELPKVTMRVRVRMRRSAGLIRLLSWTAVVCL